jgi:hypothetical protein
MDDATKAAILAQAQKNKQTPSSGGTTSVFTVVALVGFGIAGLILWPHIKKVIG